MDFLWGFVSAAGAVLFVTIAFQAGVQAERQRWRSVTGWIAPWGRDKDA
jgi:hypothetical protein